MSSAGFKTLAYVTPVTQKKQAGGVNAVSHHTYLQLSQHFELSCVYLQPARMRLANHWSKFRRRFMCKPGIFDLYSLRNLKANATAADRMAGQRSAAIFFKGTTPWIEYYPPVPYFAYTDVCFHTYFHNTFKSGQFHDADLERIWRREAKWMECAAGVFFESAWGARRAREAYGLAGLNFVPVGRGGHVPIPGEDVHESNGRALVSIANRFFQKGGDLVFEAFLSLKPRHPDLEWHIIGERPNRPWQHIDGIHFHGFLSKTDPVQLREFEAILQKAFLLVHPTREDTNPLVISEAGYFGCPSISVNRFAIPELIRHGETGLLLDPPVTSAAVADEIESLIADPVTYADMRRKARQYALEHANWDAIGDRMCEHIRRCLEKQKQADSGGWGRLPSR